MSEKLVVPDIGDFEKVEVIEILVKHGDHIKINDPRLLVLIVQMVLFRSSTQ